MVPTLSEDGWVTTPAGKVDKLLSYAYLSQASQSVLYNGNIVSVAKILAQHGTDEHGLKEELEAGFIKLMSGYFDSVEATVSVTPDRDKPTNLTINIQIYVVDDGYTYSAGHLLTTLDSNILRVFEINNEGELGNEINI